MGETGTQRVDLSWVEFSDKEDESCYECDKQAVWRLIYIRNCDCEYNFPCCDYHGTAWDQKMQDYRAAGYRAICSLCGASLIDWRLEKL